MNGKVLLLTLVISSIAVGTVRDVLTTQGPRVVTVPVFTVGSTHGSSDSINAVLITACNFAAAGFDDCFNADSNGALSSVGSLAITTGQTISISVPAIANPLNFWENFYPYNTPHTVVRITNSQGQDCDSNVVAYTCATSSSCSVLSFAPVACNFI